MSIIKGEQIEHVLPVGVYLSVAAALFVLTLVTVTVSQVELGSFNLIVALLIASIKATLVILFFMHLLYDNKMFMLIMVSSVVFVALFIVFTMFDTMRRGDIYEETGVPIKKAAVIYDKSFIITQ